MKYVKLLAAAALALSVFGCSSPSAEDTETVDEIEDQVSEDDSPAVEKALEEDAAADENGGSDVDYGTPDSAEDTTTDDSEAE